MLMPLQIGVEILHSYFPVVMEKERSIGTDLANALKPIAIGVPLSPRLTPAQKQQLDRARAVNDARRDLKTFLSPGQRAAAGREQVTGDTAPRAV